MRNLNPFPFMIACMVSLLCGCGTFVTVGADIGTTAILQKVKPPAKQIEAAKLASAIADDLDAVTEIPPNFDAINASIDARVAASTNPFAAEIGVLAKSLIADAEKFVANSTGPKSTAARVAIQDVAAGVRAGAQKYLTP